MVNKLKPFLIGAFAMTMLAGLNITAFAEEVDMEAQAIAIENTTTFLTDNVSRIIGSPRGMLISSVELSLTDLGGGTVELYGNVLCHEPMEKIRLNLFLDKWISDSESWSQQEKFELTWLAEDYPDEDLTMAMATIDVPNLDRGNDYRARCVAGAWDIDSDLYEVWNESAPSIYVE